ncbi:radical SAM family heme chaperone HemW [Campylobacter canadensis]|uniref:Heme chaperone HemW n=1 Tax=Campylobacter canadensis TaxID=449520 RepID=A0ABS7WV67_9BACT|nr:radical SAM family heme chaperone HemW [Campylobacter canadensis]MBZ7987860.1 coproporphyrinogen III oxidase family protein [Campylobacter canadensis]MBZ7998868.1 coproporphyrinogen III oxidase family protein [Campylobacter canadensis]
MRIYIHIPFCESKCAYCAFASFTNLKKIDDYFDALKKDLLRFLPLKKSIKSIYFGGGTPSVVLAQKYEDIFACLKEYFHKNIEISIEANPNSFSLEWIKSMKKLGVNRLSFGVQSFDEKKLKFLNRIHSKDEVLKAINIAKNEIENYSIDIIYGTYLDDKTMLDYELENIDKLKLNHLSAYTLILEENTSFYNKDEYLQKDDELNVYFYNSLHKIGLKAYEVSNFARSKKYICKHNLAYWQKKDYIGIGLSSVGSKANKRYYASSNFSEYVKNPCKRQIELLSKEDIRLEKIFLSLRSCVGLNVKEISQKKIKELLEENKITLKSNKIYNNNFLISNEIALYLE